MSKIALVQFKASIDKPLTLYVNDFDRNGRSEQILGMYYGDNLYPIVQLKDLWMQLPYLKKEYLKFESYKNKKMIDLLDESAMEGTKILEVYNLASLVLRNESGIKFEVDTLPFMAQISSIYSILSEDINNDGYNDLILGGNLSKIKPEFGPSKSSYSSLFFGNKDGKFEYINSNKSGIFIDGDLRDLTKIKINKKDSYIFALNNSEIKILERE